MTSDNEGLDPAGKRAFNIPHDLRILDEVFRCPDGSYSEKNDYWSSWGLQDLIASTTPEQQAGFKKRIDALRRRAETSSGAIVPSRGEKPAEIHPRSRFQPLSNRFKGNLASLPQSSWNRTWEWLLEVESLRKALVEAPCTPLGSADGVIGSALGRSQA